MNTCTYNMRPGSAYYQNLVNRITKRAGMTHTITVYESDTDNACATLYKKCALEPYKPVIAYNSKFMANLQAKSPWAVVAVLAHEVAHHHNNDLYGNYLNNRYGTKINTKSHKQELNADRFAGWILRAEGATLLEALSLYRAVRMEESESHPSEIKRRAAMTEGWKAAEKAMNPPMLKVAAPKPQSYGVAEVLLGIGAVALVGYGLKELFKEAS